MGNRILELTQQRAAMATKAADLLKVAADAKRSLTCEEQVSYDAMYKELSDIRSTIERETQQAQIETELGNTRQVRRDAQPDGKKQSDDEQRAVFNAFIRYGNDGVKPEQRHLLERASQWSDDFRMSPERRAAQTELTGAGGGYLVPQGFVASILEALKFFGGMDAAGVNVINTSMGNDLPMPTEDDTTNAATELGESSPAGVTQLTFGQIVFKAYKYTSGIILMPIELLQDSGVDIEAHINKAIVTRFGRARNNRFTVGNGVNKPRGIVLDTPTGKTGANGQGTGLLYTDLIDLKYSVNRAYRTNAKWMCNDNTLKVILKIVDSNNRPLILDYLNALQAGEPEQILGQKLVNNDDMPDLGTTGSPAVGNVPLIYGDFSNYTVRNVMSMMMMRLVERYAELGQVGFLAFMRFDGRLTDAGTHPVKGYVCPTS